ncbi:MAG: HNH endonuclease family protein, partial [Chloroflexi bacterium]|nr:HNH endonuclease family protein [Chloroflexota bacterium]
ASNKSFLEKKVKYEDSDIKITKELLGLDKWDTNAIINRTNKLFDLVTEIWPIYQYI